MYVVGGLVEGRGLGCRVDSGGVVVGLRAGVL